MKRFGFVALCALALGCSSAPNWNGEYLGAVSTSYNCVDGATGSQSMAYAIAVTESAGSLLVDIGPPCGGLTATVSGDTASVNPYVCSNGTNITGGTFRMNGDTFELSLVSTYKRSTGSQCGGSATGSLARRSH